MTKKMSRNLTYAEMREVPPPGVSPQAPYGTPTPQKSNVVYFIGPGSRVYHKDRNCPAINHPFRYWILKVGELQEDGSITTKVPSAYNYRGRRPCKRCSTEKSK